MTASLLCYQSMHCINQLAVKSSNYHFKKVNGSPKWKTCIPTYTGNWSSARNCLKLTPETGNINNYMETSSCKYNVFPPPPQLSNSMYCFTHRHTPTHMHAHTSPGYNRTGWLGVKHQLTYLHARTITHTKLQVSFLCLSNWPLFKLALLLRDSRLSVLWVQWELRRFRLLILRSMAPSVR